MIISGMFRSRLEELTNYSYIIKIRANAGPAIDTRKSIKDLEKVCWRMIINRKLTIKPIRYIIG